MSRRPGQSLGDGKSLNVLDLAEQFLRASADVKKARTGSTT